MTQSGAEVVKPVFFGADAAKGAGPDRCLSDFLNGEFPEPLTLSGGPPSGPERFFNRELSWLGFNWRVLDEARNPQVPLLERLRFLSISASNLDEFYTVRVAGLQELLREGNMTPSADGLTPAEALHLIDSDARALMALQQSVWTALKAEMHSNGISVLSPDELSSEDNAELERYFLDYVFPVVSPMAIDPLHPFPFIPNMGFSLAVELVSRETLKAFQALILLPQNVTRFIPLGEGRFLTMENLLLQQIEQLFPGCDLVGHCSFRILRDSDLEIEEDAEDLVREFEIALKRRRRGEVVRLKMSAKAPEHLRRLIVRELDVEPEEVVEIDGMIGIADLSELVLETRRDLLYMPFTPRMPKRIQNHDGDLFAAIRQQDMLLHHPYEAFDIVVSFLRQAARDPHVVAIKQTLYRTSRDSPIVEALCEAAEAGKAVTALVELQARFDEAANIRQSRRLERAGVQVGYGFIRYKTHAKMSMVVRREGSRLVTYTHFGTGNYHPITARIYTDLSLFTADQALGRDAVKTFNFLTGSIPPQALENISASPLDMKTDLLAMIHAEAEAARAGKPAAIWAKMNSLIEKDMIDALYEASMAGVRISLVVRGICGLRPGIVGLSENIRVKSIVGRFLEHSRIVCFGNGGGLPSADARVFISSADWMGRNLKRRVEVLVECMDPAVKAQILYQVMAANMADVSSSWVLDAGGRYMRHIEAANPDSFSCHRYFMDNPSLSGSGADIITDIAALTHDRD